MATRRFASAVPSGDIRDTFESIVRSAAGLAAGFVLGVLLSRALRRR